MRHAYDPELASALQYIPPVDLTDVEANRVAGAAAIAMWAERIDRTGTRSRWLELPALRAGDPAVRVHVTEPDTPGTDRPAILDLHGGGFVVGSALASEARSVALARELGAVVVAVDYRLAPEHPYPAALDDAYAALVSLSGDADAFGVDPARIALVGQSAGGGLAAALAMLARDRGGPAVAFQYLGVPEIDDRLETPSMRAYDDTPFWSRPNAEISWRHYLGGIGDVPITAAPARAAVEDLVGLPPAYVSAMQFDPLRDEGIAYAARLAQAGVPTELHLFPSTFHASFVIGDAQVSRRETDEQVRVLRAALR